MKNISLEIPRNKFVVLTGVSGSGKSTLAIDTIYQECQRQYLEAIGYQGIHKPKIDFIQNVSPAIRITQNEYNKNPRSSVGTVTNIYTELRMIYEKLGMRTCPKCGKEIFAYKCKEEVQKNGDDFQVFMYCSECGHKMDKLTRTYFSFNTREGACPTCHGLGKILTVNKSSVLHEELSLEDGAVDFWEQKYKDYQIEVLYQAFRYYGVMVKPGTPVRAFHEGQMAILLHGVQSQEVKERFPDLVSPKTVAEGRFEGIYTVLFRRMSEKGGSSKKLEAYFEFDTCPDCLGERLQSPSRSVTVMNTRLPQLAALSLDELSQWLSELQDSVQSSQEMVVNSYLLDLKTKIQRMVNVGLNYLSLDRQTMTLSGGEAQRIKLAATLDSDLTGVIYLLDEPTIGLHPKDTAGMIKILKGLKDLGNTLIVIEHDVDIMKAADYIIDIGPGAGKYGGEIIGTGTLEEIKAQEKSVTGAYLVKADNSQINRDINSGNKIVVDQSYQKVDIEASRERRKGNGRIIEIENADLHNLKGINVSLPVGCLICITGVSGSGKSTLIFDVLAKGKQHSEYNRVRGLEGIENLITIEQTSLTRMKRSNVATYSSVYSEIRKIFGGLEDAKKAGLTAKHFSFNTKGGRCEYCEGLGYVTSNMLFFEDMEVPCPICGGNQFNEEILAIRYKGYSIKDVLKMSVTEAADLFKEHAPILKILSLLAEVGLGYLELGQILTTLSGGEGQRLKLAKELLSSQGKQNLYLIDEPTTGLHPIDVENFLKLLNKLVDLGSTVIVVEHNQQLIREADWIIDLGPEGGINGGTVIAMGTPEQVIKNKNSVTGRFL